MRSLFKKVGIAALAALSLVGATLAASSSAEARYYGRGWGGGWVGPAIVGGLALGALAASRPYYYGGYVVTVVTATTATAVSGTAWSATPPMAARSFGRSTSATEQFQSGAVGLDILPPAQRKARRLSIGVGLLIYSTADSTLWAWGLPPQLAGGAERLADGVILRCIIEGDDLFAARAWHAEAAPDFSGMLPEGLPALGAFNSDLVG